MKLAKIYGSLQNNQTTVQVSKKARQYVAQFAPDMLQDIVEIAENVKRKRESVPKGLLNKIGRFFLRHLPGDQKLVITKKDNQPVFVDFQMSEWVKSRTLSGVKRVDGASSILSVEADNKIKDVFGLAQRTLEKNVATQKALDALKNM